MTDVVFLAITVAFFAMMIGYVRGCELLGREPEGDSRQ